MVSPPLHRAEDILATQPEDARLLLAGDEASIEATWRSLALHWCPDRNPDPRAPEVEAHLAVLFGAALSQARGAAPAASPALGTLVMDDAGTAVTVPYATRAPYELGEVFVGRDAVAWTVDEEYRDFYEAARAALSALRFADPDMRAQMVPSLPLGARFMDGRDGLAVVVPKAPDLVRLAELQARFGGGLDPRHVAWIQSAQHNLCCYLEWAGLCHPAIGPETLFVSPRRHAVALLGGWWCAAALGAPLIGVPARTLSIVSADLMKDRRGSASIPLELVRANGRELLCGASGPRAMSGWLSERTSGSAVEDYAQWRRVLEMDFGPRRFVRLDVDFEDVHG